MSLVLAQKTFAYFILCHVAATILGGVAAFTHFGNCSSPTGNVGFCVPFRQCKALYGLLMKPTLRDSEVAHLRHSKCGFILSNILVCCTGTVANTTTEDYSPPDSSTLTTSQSIHTSNLNTPFSHGPLNTKLNGPTGRPTPADALLPSPPQCGTQTTSRIHGDVQTNIDEFPWLVLLQYKEANDEMVFKSEGTLINEYYVLTAAHCLSDRAGHLTSVRLGEWNISTSPDCVDGHCAPKQLDIAIAQRIAHPHFSVAARTNDIGLLRLAQRVTYSRYVKPICLPTAPAEHSEQLAGSSAIIAGWGETEYGFKSNVKLQASLNIHPQRECSMRYQRFMDVNISTSQLCAGGANEGGPCRGNGGGPLMMNRGAYVLVGVVSYGVTLCGPSEFPSVFTRVDAYIDWIRNTIQP